VAGLVLLGRHAPIAAEGDARLDSTRSRKCIFFDQPSSLLRRICAVSRLDWSRPLPRPLNIPTVMKLSTLADVRDLVEKHLPEQYRRKPAWRHVSSEIAKAAEGETD
jgi:hypothetical protein